METRALTLRQLVLATTGQDVRKCARCSYCADLMSDEEDISLEMLIQLVLMNDDEVLTSRTLWSDSALEEARKNCIGALDLGAIMLALRDEARRRGVIN